MSKAGISKNKLSLAEDICWSIFNTNICDCCYQSGLVRSSQLTGGLSNILVKVTIDIDSFCEEMKRANRNNLTPNLKVRFYSEERGIFVNDKRESLIRSLLSEVGIGKPVLHYFEGGQVEEFIEGRTLEVEDLRQRPVYVQIAKKIASLHSIRVTDEITNCILQEYNASCEPTNKNTSDSFIQPISILWPTLENWLVRSEAVCKANSDAESSKNVNFGKLRKLINKLKNSLYSETLSDLTCSIVISHCDLLPGNIVELCCGNYDFIDYEFSGTMECVFDIGNHLCEWAGFLCNWEYLPNNETITDFVKAYIASLSRNAQENNDLRLHMGKSSVEKPESFRVNLEELENNIKLLNHNLKLSDGSVLDEITLINSFVRSVKICMIISNIFWGLWAICKSDFGFINSNHHFDYRSYGYKKLESINTQSYFREILKEVDQYIEFPVF
ncbi:putative ethanolamine kinase [Cryptosporidium felis]|nr:putative ethanolamine kinase [Cryptosporidium felis]